MFCLLFTSLSVSFQWRVESWHWRTRLVFVATSYKYLEKWKFEVYYWQGTASICTRWYFKCLLCFILCVLDVHSQKPSWFIFVIFKNLSLQLLATYICDMNSFKFLQIIRFSKIAKVIKTQLNTIKAEHFRYFCNFFNKKWFFCIFFIKLITYFCI